jgi:hypothetical protein
MSIKNPYAMAAICLLADLALCAVLVFAVVACSERVQRNFNALTTPGPGMVCGVGVSCMPFDNTHTCCGPSTHCSNFGCSADDAPGAISDVHYWGASRDAGAAHDTPRLPEQH